MLISFLHTAHSAHTVHGRFIICSECDIRKHQHIMYSGLLSLSRSAVQEKAISRSFSVYPSLPWSDIATSPLLRCPFVSWLLDLSTSVFCICLINWLACVSLRVSGQTKIDGLSDDTARFHSEMHTQEVFWSPFETMRCKIWSLSRFHSKLVCSRNCEICYHVYQ